MNSAPISFLYGEFAPRCNHHIDKQFVGYSTLQYIAGGRVELWIGAKRFRLEGRAFWSCYPGPRIRFFPAEQSGTWVHRYIAFQGPLIKRWQREGLFPVAPSPSPSDNEYGPRFDELLRHARRADAHGQRRAVNLLESMLIELAEVRGPATAQAPWLRDVIDRLTDVKQQPPDYASLAAVAGLSQSMMRRRFRQATGTSPHAFVLQSRAAEARRLLAETDLPIKVIAEQLGYRDVYFFSRQFRQLTGVPPAEFRNSTRE